VGAVDVVVESELARLRGEVDRLRAENARLARLLDLRGQDTVPAAEQLSAAVAPPGLVSMSSPVEDKLALYAHRFRARTDVYAVRWDNARTGASGWTPAVAGGWRKGMDRKAASYLPLNAEVVSAHLVGDVFIGLYPLLADSSCHFLVADFDGPAAMLDALAYAKAARASAVPAALEISQSGRGAHVWVFFTEAVPAGVARCVGTALVHEAMVLRGSMDLRSYDRLFPNLELGLRRTLPQADSDPPELRPAAGGDHDADAGAAVDHRAHQRAAAQVGQRGAGDDRHRGLLGRQRLAGEHRLLALQLGGGQQPQVGRHDLAELHVDHVAGDQVGDVHGAGVPVADHQAAVADTGVQRLGSLLRAVLVAEPQAHRSGEDDADDHGVGRLAEERRRHRGHRQQEQQRRTELADEDGQRPGMVRPHGVGAGEREPPPPPTGRIGCCPAG
jgi:TOTE conflict system, Archaeo-Eukaryotic Primase domain